jgi:serine/threonine-protein kinase
VPLESEASGVHEGDVIDGRYRVERVLGVGGMGVVVAAHHMQLDEKVALKFLVPEALGNAEAVARFAREAQAAVKIKSEHVARVIDVGTLESGAPFIVMEYLEGEDLAAWIAQRGVLPIEQAVEFLLQACVAVADAHALGIVHRDLKPANLFCVRRSDGQLSIKVLDFGISKMTDARKATSGSLTRTTSVMGSPLYMSPEQMRTPKDVGTQADIWALGVILFELLTGKHAFEAESVMDLAIKVANDPPPRIQTFRPDVPEALEAVILKCLQKDRRQRYANVAELAVDLLPFGPKRARGSVERISGIIQAAGLSSTALALPASGGTGGGVGSTEGVPAVGRTTGGTGGRKVAVVGGTVGVVVLLAAVGALMVLGKQAPTHGEVVPGAAPPLSSGAAAVPAPSASAARPADAAVAATPSPVAPPTAAALAPPDAATSARNRPPARGAATPAPPAASKPATSTPCKLVKTLDAYGEPHFTCPCATCS